jgi:cation-transporting ATPase 13A1
MLTKSCTAGDTIAPTSAAAQHRTQPVVRRRFQFSSALKRMSTISSLPGGKTLASVKGAPETIRGMLKECPAWYDETYKWYTRRGSRALALGAKDMDTLNMDKVRLGPVMRDGF